MPRQGSDFILLDDQHTYKAEIARGQKFFQLSERFMDAVSFNFCMVTHTFEYFDLPSKAHSLVLILGVSVNDLFKEKIWTPLVTDPDVTTKIFTKATLKRAAFEMTSLTAVGALWFASSGQEWGNWYKKALNSLDSIDKFALQSSFGLAGWVIKGGMVAGFMKGCSDDGFNPLAVENKKEQTALQKAAQFIEEFVYDHAGKETLRWILMQTGNAVITNHVAFAPLALFAVDFTRNALSILGRTPTVLKKCYADGSSLEVSPEEIQALREEKSPASRDERLESAMLEASDPEQERIPYVATKKDLARSVGIKFLESAASGSIALAINCLALSSGMPDEEKARNDSNHTASAAWRFLYDFGRFTVGCAPFMIYGAWKYGLWGSRSGSNPAAAAEPVSENQNRSNMR